MCLVQQVKPRCCLSNSTTFAVISQDRIGTDSFIVLQSVSTVKHTCIDGNVLDELAARTLAIKLWMLEYTDRLQLTQL